jgi:hypothetical protein
MADRLTALEVIKRINNPNGIIIELEMQKNEYLLDLPMIECNMGSYHSVLRRATTPHGMHRGYYQGVFSEASQTVAVKEPTTTVMAFSKVDEELLKDSQKEKEIRNSEAFAHIQGMGESQALNLTYGKASDPSQGIDGFATRYAKVDDTHVFDAGGTVGMAGNLTSIYMAAVGQHFTHLIYPKGNPAGIDRLDNGRQKAYDPNRTKNGQEAEYYVKEDQFIHKYGLAIENADSVIRIANVPVDLDVDGSEALLDMLLSRMRRMPSGASTYVLYANYTIQDILDKAAYKKQNVIYPTTDPWGKPITMLRNFRVRTVEAITDGEDFVPRAA